MGKSSSAPKQPDPAELSRLQGIEDRKTMKAGLEATRTSTINPYGSTSWRKDTTFDQAGWDKAMAAYTASGVPQYATNPRVTREGQDEQGAYQGMQYGLPAPDKGDYSSDKWTNEQVLSPESQGIYDTATAKLGDATKNISTDARAYNQEVADAVQRRMSRYTDPQMALERSQMQTNLADRGFQVGNEGFNGEMSRMEDRQNTARADIADRAQITGAQQGMQELSMQQQIASALQNLRGAQVNGVAGMPSTTTAPEMQPFDIAGTMMNNYNNELDAYNAQQQNSSSGLGSLLSIGGSLLGGPAGSAGAQLMSKMLGR